MKNVGKKILAISIIAAMGISFVACGSTTSDDSKTNESESATKADTLSSEEVQDALKQNLTVTLDDEDSVENNGQDATEAQSSDGDDNGSDNETSGNSGGSNGSVTYEEVTGDDGSEVTNENGNVETVTVAATSDDNSGGNSGNNNNDDTSGNNGGNGDSSSYVSKITTAKTYWLDMTKESDYVFDGEFLVATFKVKETTPDGSYPIEIAKADIANYNSDTLVPDIINGYVTVGDAETPTVSSPKDGNFTIAVESVEAQVGDTIEVKFNISDNPGFVAFVFNFSFDSNALEYVDLEVGDDAADIIELQQA